MEGLVGKVLHGEALWHGPGGPIDLGKRHYGLRQSSQMHARLWTGCRRSLRATSGIRILEDLREQPWRDVLISAGRREGDELAGFGSRMEEVAAPARGDREVGEKEKGEKKEVKEKEKKKKKGKKRKRARSSSTTSSEVKYKAEQ